MNPEDQKSANNPNEQDTGQPIRVLIDQEYETSPEFVGKIRRKIYRRTTASHYASYSWHMPRMILMEMAGLLGHLLKAFGTNKESKL